MQAAVKTPGSKKDIQNKIKGVSLRVLIVAGVFIIAFLVFITITDEIVLEHENTLDFTVFKWLSHYTTPAHTRMMTFITFFGSNYFLLPAYILLISFYFFFKKASHISVNILAIGLSSTGLLFLLKDIFRRHRPLDPLIKNVRGFSFPSGHSFCSFTFFGILIYMLWKADIKRVYKWLFSVVFFLLASLIAFSRVYLHVHFASDVVAGFCLSIVWLTLSFWILDKLKFLKNRSLVQPINQS